jgi:hypothetical protein
MKLPLKLSAAETRNEAEYIPPLNLFADEAFRYLEIR